MFGFGPKLSHVFASRWKAATWSLGVLLTAYCSVPSPEQTRQSEPAPSAAQVHHKSPWSKD
ncbi:MAG: hypothetical protein ACLGHF_08350 [Alphaproteobacteria bacterium]